MTKCERIFLLSPARFGGRRSLVLLGDRADFDLSNRLRAGTATLGEAYSFISGLYFRGKLAYASAFGSAFVIVPGRGLVSPDTIVTAEDLRDIGSISVEESNPAFREPLVAAGLELFRRAGPQCEFVLLGSIATDKYVEPLLHAMGERLLFPQEFIGRGDMSRGGLMLRSARSGSELTYIGLEGATRRGQRPPKLEWPR